MSKWLLSLALWAVFAAAGRAEFVAKPIAYTDGGTQLEGVLVHDNAVAGKRPTVIVAHELGANSSLARQRALQFAKLGYVAFSIDLFGKGIAPKDGKDAAAKLGIAGKDRSALRKRALAGFQALEKLPPVNPKQVAAVGYGWGGTAMLELARSGAEIESVAVVHGDLTSPAPVETKTGGGWMLAICGSEDPSIPLVQVASFEAEMKRGGFEWDVYRIGGAAHDFTNPQAGSNRSSGTAYDADSDKRAHEMIRSFLAETFDSNPSGVPLAKLPNAKPAPAKVPQGIPEKVMAVLKHVDEKGEPLPNHEGGRTFGNFEGHLPVNDRDGKRIKYREWDVNPLVRGVNRGVERMITGSDGSAYFTDDHYKTFKKIR